MYGELLLDLREFESGSPTLKSCAEHYAAEHHAVFPGLISFPGLRILQDEIRRLRSEGVRKEFLMDCMEGSPRRMTTLGGDVVDKLSSLIPGIYRDPLLLDVIEATCGERVIPLEDDVDRYVINILDRKDDTFGAHFDDYPLSVVLIIEAPHPEEGGYPELVPRAKSVSELETEPTVPVRLAAGDVYVLKADTTAHRVAPLRSDRERIAINLAYTTPDFVAKPTESASLLYSREPVVGGFTAARRPVVESHNEWDLLEEVIVGVADGAMFPAETRRMIEATMPAEYWDLFTPGRPFPEDIVAAAQDELDNFASVLVDEGIVVRRPDRLDLAAIGGHTCAMPRDCLMVAGSEIIEAPMSWVSRRSETLAYRPLLSRYQAEGSHWHSAPRVLEHSSLLNNDPYAKWAINNSQPAFDAADFLKFGRDIVAQLSHVTNQAGIDWLSHHLGEGYRMHVLDTNDEHAMHIDATIMPLRSGLMLFNPERIDVSTLRNAGFREWELVPTPRPEAREHPPLFMTSGWVNMNLLVLDEGRVVVEEQDEKMVALLSELGFRPIRCPFRHVQSLGGSFHCATLDVRRRGQLRSYLQPM